MDYLGATLELIAMAVYHKDRPKDRRPHGVCGSVVSV